MVDRQQSLGNRSEPQGPQLRPCAGSVVPRASDTMDTDGHSAHGPLTCLRGHGLFLEKLYLCPNSSKSLL